MHCRIFGGAHLELLGRGKTRTTFKDIAGIDQVLPTLVLWLILTPLSYGKLLLQDIPKMVPGISVCNHGCFELRLLRWSASQEVHAERVSTDQISSYCYPAQLGKPSMPAACFKRLPRRAQVKAEIQEVVQFLRNPRRFLDLGARSPAGILLVGPPGTGAPL